MTLPHLLKGLAAGLNMGADFTVLIGGLGLLSSPRLVAFDLNDLDQHNFPIEHDASLSREDAYFGNDYSFNSGIWNETRSFFEKDRKTALLSAALALANRTADSKERNPQFVYGFREFVQRYGEMSIFIQTMGGYQNGVARLDWVDQLFTQERLPYNLGWRPRAEPITVPSLGQMVFDIFSVSPDKFSEGATITA
jgi:hypothetical protein